MKGLSYYFNSYWSSVLKLAGLERCGKSYRPRWINYLRLDLQRGTFSQQREKLITELHEFFGNKLSKFATQLPGITDNEINNLWKFSKLSLGVTKRIRKVLTLKTNLKQQQL